MKCCLQSSLPILSLSTHVSIHVGWVLPLVGTGSAFLPFIPVMPASHVQLLFPPQPSFPSGSGPASATLPGPPAGSWVQACGWDSLAMLEVFIAEKVDSHLMIKKKNVLSYLQTSFFRVILHTVLFL